MRVGGRCRHGEVVSKDGDWYFILLDRTWLQEAMNDPQERVRLHKDHIAAVKGGRKAHSR